MTYQVNQIPYLGIATVAHLDTLAIFYKCTACTFINVQAECILIGIQMGKLSVLVFHTSQTKKNGSLIMDFCCLFIYWHAEHQVKDECYRREIHILKVHTSTP